DDPRAESSYAPTEIVLETPSNLVGQRLDVALTQLLPGYSRTRASAAIRAGQVRVNGRAAKSSLLLETGMRIEVRAGESTVSAARAPRGARDAPALQVVYEDDDMLVVNKQAGVVVHPAPGHSAGTLVDALLEHVPDVEGGEDESRPGIVHRLDKDTSGLLVIAKTARAHADLADQMKRRSMVKRYIALVEGHFAVSDGVVEAPIGRDPRMRQRMAVVSEARGGRAARTHFHVAESHRGRTLLDVRLETGRTHQIRVHLAAIHHPVVGDAVYGRPQPPQPPRQFLHAAHLELAHPRTGEWMVFDTPLPDDLESFLAEWRS
ncbi:MAG TPA: RluA family pseudouridine synthase, partial [Ktedonobacterales bacterium]|nr:RluA family pseudouridine synthase [Ktedonobacterales bacterium]